VIRNKSHQRNDRISGIEVVCEYCKKGG